MSEQTLAQWKLAALLKDRTRREIRQRASVSGKPGHLAIAEDFGVPVEFVDVVASWQIFADDDSDPIATLTARCEALEAERDEKAESANDYYRQCIGLREQLAAEKSRCEALAAERDEKARSLDELATLVGAALVYATLDSEGGEKPLVEPDHAITETVWKLVQERGKAESLCQHLEQAIREITKACDAGMRLSLPSSDIVGRIRAALASLLPTQEEAK